MFLFCSLMTFFFLLGSPTSEVIIVSGVLALSLSITIVMCGLCQWCQRKLVSTQNSVAFFLVLIPSQMQSSDQYCFISQKIYRNKLQRKAYNVMCMH